MKSRIAAASSAALALLLIASPALAGRWESRAFATGSFRPNGTPVTGEIVTFVRPPVAPSSSRH